MSKNALWKVCIVAATIVLGLPATSANATTSRWIALNRVAAFSKSMRSFGHHGLVTSIECGLIRGKPAMKFTYDLVSTPVFYKYAWSMIGEEEFKKRARTAFKTNAKIISCHMGKFYYGMQNIQ